VTNGNGDGRSPLLRLHDLHAGYGEIQVLHGIDLEVYPGEVVVVLGANGAGKTTTLRAICQMIDVKGTVEFEDQQLVGRATTDVVRRGIAHVPQGRGTFPDLTVEENLEVGAYTRKDGEARSDVDSRLSIFPRLGERRTQLAGSMSGGEQQMLAIARALMGRPKLLLLDEPSLGLAPIIVQDLFRRLGELNQEQGTTMLVVEQNANLAFSIANRAYVLEAGEIAISGRAEDLRHDDAIRKAYLGY
jgi:branched-chain amino acid transport system ATP-binding protein